MLSHPPSADSGSSDAHTDAVLSPTDGRRDAVTAAPPRRAVARRSLSERVKLRQSQQSQQSQQHAAQASQPGSGVSGYEFVPASSVRDGTESSDGQWGKWQPPRPVHSQAAAAVAAAVAVPKAEAAGLENGSGSGSGSGSGRGLRRPAEGVSAAVQSPVKAGVRRSPMKASPMPVTMSAMKVGMRRSPMKASPMPVTAAMRSPKKAGLRRSPMKASPMPMTASAAAPTAPTLAMSMSPTQSQTFSHASPAPVVPFFARRLHTDLQYDAGGSGSGAGAGVGVGVGAGAGARAGAGAGAATTPSAAVAANTGDTAGGGLRATTVDGIPTAAGDVKPKSEGWSKYVYDDSDCEAQPAPPPPPKFLGISHADRHTPCLSTFGVNVYFPPDKQPFPSQKCVMSGLIRAVVGKHNALLESPTGTGKTLALLSSALAVQEHLRGVSAQRASDAGRLETSQPAHIYFASRTHSQVCGVVAFGRGCQR